MDELSSRGGASPPGGADLQLTVVLRPSPARWLAVLAICAAFTAIGVVQIRAGVREGWFVAGFFGLGALAAIVVLLPGSSYLKVRQDGFVFGTMFRRWFMPWTAVGPFSIARVAGRELVVFDVIDPSASSRLGGLSRMIVGANAGLPDTYGMTAGELAGLLNAARERALARASRAG
jgi:hypothetical protein